MALRADGTLWVWGTNNSQGTFGTLDVNASKSSPVVVVGKSGKDSTFTTISSGSYGDHAHAMGTSNTLYSWGGYATTTGTIPIAQFPSIYASNIPFDTPVSGSSKNISDNWTII